MSHHGALFAGTIITANIVWNKPSEVCRNCIILSHNRLCAACIHVFSYAEIADMQHSVYNSAYINVNNIQANIHYMRLYSVSAIMLFKNLTQFSTQLHKSST